MVGQKEGQAHLFQAGGGRCLQVTCPSTARLSVIPLAHGLPHAENHKGGQQQADFQQCSSGCP